MPQKDYEYSSEFCKWMGFVEKIPLLGSILNANVDADVASWRCKGEHASEMADILDGMVGNGKENFPAIMKNMLMISKIGGDSYAEIIYEGNDPKNGDIEDLKILNPDNIKQVVKNGVITKYAERDGGNSWVPEGIFHLAFNRIGSAPHGRSMIEPMNNLLIHFMQVQDDMSRLFHRYIKPMNVFRFKTNSDVEINKWMTEFRHQASVSESDIGIPDDLVSTIDRVSLPQGSSLDPSQWHSTLINQFLMSSRVSENILGIGTQNSEESARMQMAGFAQLVRSDQKFAAWNCRQQIFTQQFPRNTPKIEFSFAIEPQEERFIRLRDTIPIINASGVSPELKNLLTQKVLIEMGVIEDD